MKKVKPKRQPANFLIPALRHFAGLLAVLGVLFLILGTFNLEGWSGAFDLQAQLTGMFLLITSIVVLGGSAAQPH